MRRFLVLIIGIAGTLCWGQSADEWNYFDPVRVTKLSCRTERVRHDAAGIDPTREELVWQAEAFAERRARVGTPPRKPAPSGWMKPQSACSARRRRFNREYHDRARRPALQEQLAE